MKAGELAVAQEDCCSNIPTLRFERVDNLGAYRIPSETGILIPSGYVSHSKTGWSETGWIRHKGVLSRPLLGRVELPPTRQPWPVRDRACSTKQFPARRSNNTEEAQLSESRVAAGQPVPDLY